MLPLSLSLQLLYITVTREQSAALNHNQHGAGEFLQPKLWIRISLALG
jgi:hypothetical protein